MPENVTYPYEREALLLSVWRDGREYGGGVYRVRLRIADAKEDAHASEHLVRARMRRAATEYCCSQDGREAFAANNYDYNWGDAAASLPEELLAKHGIPKVEAITGDLVALAHDESLVSEYDLRKFDATMHEEKPSLRIMSGPYGEG